MKKTLNMAILTILFSFIFLINSAQAAQSKPKYGGILKVGRTATSTMFGDPVNFRGTGAYYGGIALEGLLRITNRIGAYDPELATSFELAEDNSAYTFHLRKGVKFHDGTDFNAHAVKWSLDRSAASELVIMKWVKSIDVVDDYTVRVNLATPWNVLIPVDFTREAASIISPTAFEKNGGTKWANTHPVGTGAYKFKSYRRRQYCHFEKNPDYWMEGIPYLDEIQNHAVRDPMTQLASLKTGDLDLLLEADTIQIQEIENDKRFKPVSFVGGTNIIWFNSTDPDSIWSDKRMREALEYAIDKEKIAKTLGRGFRDPVYEIISGIHDYGDPPTTPRKYDPEKARQLMAEAGHKTAKLKMTTLSLFYNDFIVALQEQLGNVGIELLLQPLSESAWSELRWNAVKGSDLMYDRQQGGTVLLSTSINTELISTADWFPGVKRPDSFDEIFEKAIITPDAEKQSAMFGEMERLAYEDTMFVSLWTDPGLWIVRNDIKTDREWDDVWFVGGKPMVYFDNLYLDR